MPSSSSWPSCATSRCRRRNSRRRATTCAADLELRLEESRHLASSIGVQEALHERVLTLDEAIESLEAVTAEQIQELAGRLFVDEGLTLAVVTPPRHGASLDRALHLP